MKPKQSNEQLRGGWGWVFLPLLFMMVGSNIVWALLMLRVSDPVMAGKETYKVGPLTWSLLQMGLLWIAYKRLQKLGRPLSSLIGFARERLRSDVVLAVGLAVASQIVIMLSIRMIGRLLPPNPAADEITFYPWALIWWTTIGSVTAGVGEEAYFRGFLMERLGWLRKGWLVLITSFSFAIWHANPLLFLHTFIIGLLFGWTYLKVKRLFPLMLGHMLTNVAGGVFMLLGWS
jgi:membrane protease YdiL (CAAX protease family)